MTGYTQESGVSRLLCDNCGGEVPGGKRFCTKCGTPVKNLDPRNAATSLPSLRPPDDPAPRRAPSAQPPPAPGAQLPSLSGEGPMGMGAAAPPQRPEWLAAPGMPGAQPPPQDLPALGGDPDVPAQPVQSAHPKIPMPEPQSIFSPPEPQYDEAYIQSVVEEEKRREALARRFYRRPKFWFLFSTLLMAPGLFLPWITLNSGPVLDAFHLPLVLMILGYRIGHKFITVGAILSVLLGAGVVLSLRSDRIVSYLRLIAVVAVLLAMGAFLFGLRSWNMNKTDTASYEKYEDRQMEILIDAYGKDSRIAAQDLGYVQPSPTGLVDFLKIMLGSGILFPLLGALALVGSSYVFASSQRFLSLQVPTTLLAVVIVAGSIAGVLAILNVFFPARWYEFTASSYETVGLRSRQEKVLEQCAQLPAAPLSCEMKLGKLYLDTNRTDKALNYYRDIGRRYPDYPDVNKYIGMIYFRRRTYDLSVLYLFKYRDKRKTDAEANKILSMALRRMADQAHEQGNLADAIAGYQKAYDLVDANKNDSGFNLRLGQLYAEKGDVKNAAEYLKRAANRDGQSVDLQVQAAEALEAAREYKDAKEFYGRCIEIKADSLPCYYHLAMIQYLVDKDKDAALQTIAQGLAVIDVGNHATELKDLRLKIQGRQ